MFRIPSNIKTESIKDNVYDIGSLVYKFSTNTMLRADAAINHIKRNKKIYKNMVLYLAICMSPELVRTGHWFIMEFISWLSMIPKESLFDALFNLFKQVSLYLISLMIMKDTVVVSWNTVINKIKK